MHETCLETERIILCRRARGRNIEGYRACLAYAREAQDVRGSSRTGKSRILPGCVVDACQAKCCSRAVEGSFIVSCVDPPKANATGGSKDGQRRVATEKKRVRTCHARRSLRQTSSTHLLVPECASGVRERGSRGIWRQEETLDAMPVWPAGFSAVWRLVVQGKPVVGESALGGRLLV